MRWPCAFCFFLAAFSVTAAAADADQNLKQKVEQIGLAYAESFNKQDGSGIAALFANGGIHVNPAGPRSDIDRLMRGRATKVIG
jgi:uncharacterized protein with LGFP repeats